MLYFFKAVDRSLSEVIFCKDIDQIPESTGTLDSNQKCLISFYPLLHTPPLSITNMYIRKHMWDIIQ